MTDEEQDAYEKGYRKGYFEGYEKLPYNSDSEWENK